MNDRLRQHSAGFTLIEAIMVIVITGVLAGMVAVFIAKPVEGYVDSVRRAELTDNADVALRRIARDVRLALPNSLRQTSATSFEFIITKAGGRYRSDGDGSAGNVLSFVSATASFDVLGSLPTSPTIAPNDYIVVYNLGEGYDPANAYSGGNRVQVNSSWGGTNPVTLTAATQSVFSSQSPPLPSPDSRFQVVGQNEKAVRYTCSGNVLTRHSGCDFADTSLGCTSAVLAGSGSTTATCSFDYTSAAAGRNGLLFVQLILSSGGESVSLFQQIHVDNAP